MQGKYFLTAQNNRQRLPASKTTALLMNIFDNSNVRVRHKSQSTSVISHSLSRKVSSNWPWDWNGGSKIRRPSCYYV